MNVSVIIPVYNAEKYIKKAIESCLQLSEIKEIIVIDDGYNDKSKEIILTFVKEHSFIKLYEHPNNENKGAGASRNLGIEKATQEFIAFLDADDFFLPSRFTKDKSVFHDNPDADGCYNAIGCFFYSETAKNTYLSHFNSTITTVNQKSNPSPDNLFKGLLGLKPNYGYFSLDGLSVKREFLIKNGIFFPISSMHEDTVFILKLAHYGRLYPSRINEPVTMRGVHEENRITANYEQTEIIHNRNLFLMWKSLYNWSKTVKLNKDEYKFIRYQYTVYRVLSDPAPKLYNLIKQIILDWKLILNKSYRSLIIKKLKIS